MQVRYRYRSYPSRGQQQALARVFGCARVVHNDCMRLRDACYAAGEIGTVHDPDVNAAKNILAAGRAERLNACGASVRPPLTVAAGAEAGTHRSAA